MSIFEIFRSILENKSTISKYRTRKSVDRYILSMRFTFIVTFMAILTVSYYILFKNLHTTRVSFCDILNSPELSIINHVRVFELFLIISFFSHILRTCSLANDWSQTTNLRKNSDNQLKN